MPPWSNHELKENDPFIRVGTLEPMRIKDILTKNRIIFRTPTFWNTSKTHNNIEFGKELKTIIVSDTHFVLLVNSC